MLANSFITSLLQFSQKHALHMAKSVTIFNKSIILTIEFNVQKSEYVNG